jgi:hypothetical protein
MAEYIERNFALDVVKRTSGDYAAAFAEIAHAPAADVELVVLARWKFFNKQNKAVCTNCSWERDLDWNLGRAVSCPNCGATMDT